MRWGTWRCLYLSVSGNFCITSVLCGLSTRAGSTQWQNMGPLDVSLDKKLLMLLLQRQVTGTIKVYIYVGDMYDENLLHRVRYVNLNIVIWYFKLWNGLPEPLGFYSQYSLCPDTAAIMFVQDHLMEIKSIYQSIYIQHLLSEPICTKTKDRQRRHNSKARTQDIHDQSMRHRDLLQILYGHIVRCRHTVQLLASIRLTRYTGIKKETATWI